MKEQSTDVAQMQMEPAPDSLTNFQNAFGRYLRDPHTMSIPPAIPAARASIYATLLFNNLRRFLDQCFPICREIISNEDWADLARNFFRDWRCQTPYFSEIPEEFVNFLETNKNALPIPVWLPALAHYEWVELAAEISTHTVQPIDSVYPESTPLAVNPTLQHHLYDWPVHRISRQALPPTAETTCLLIYRNARHEVQFMQVNKVTSCLITFASQATSNASTLLTNLADSLSLDKSEAYFQFGLEQIEELVKQQVFTMPIERN